MDFNQTKEIFQHVSRVEGKAPNVEVARAWHDLIGFLDFEVANRAAFLALSDHNILSVAPKHVLAKVPAAVAELNAVLRKSSLDEESWKSEPQPICKGHDLNILECDSCCGVLSSEVGHLYGDRLHEWAKAHVYRADSLVENMGRPF